MFHMGGEEETGGLVGGEAVMVGKLEEEEEENNEAGEEGEPNDLNLLSSMVSARRLSSLPCSLSSFSISFLDFSLVSFSFLSFFSFSLLLFSLCFALSASFSFPLSVSFLSASFLTLPLVDFKNDCRIVCNREISIVGRGSGAEERKKKTEAGEIKKVEQRKRKVLNIPPERSR